MRLAPDEAMALVVGHAQKLAHDAWVLADRELERFPRVVLPTRSAIAYLEGVLLRQLTWAEVAALIRSYRNELHILNVQHELDELDRRQ